MGHIRDHQKRKRYLSVFMTVVAMLSSFGMGILVGAVLGGLL